MGSTIHAKTVGGPESLQLIEAPGQPAASGVLIVGAEGRIALLCRGRGVQLGPLEAGDLRQLGRQILAAADEREAAERQIAGRAAAAIRRALQ
jgi:hypothetical protein